MVIQGGNGFSVCDTDDGKIVREWKDAASPAGFTSDDQAISMIGKTVSLSWLAAPGFTALGELVHYTWPIEEPRFSPGGQSIAVPTSRGDVTIWRAPRVKLEPVRLMDRVGRFAVSRDGWIAAADGAEVKIFDPSNRLAHALTLRTNITVPAFSRDGEWLAVGTLDGDATLLRTRTAQSVATCPGQGHPFWKITFSPDGKVLAAGSADGWLHRWSLPSGKLLLPLQDLLSASPSPFGRRDINAVEFTPDGRRLAVACGNGQVHVFPASATNASSVLSHDGASVLDACFSNDGRRLAVACFDSYARIYETASGQALTAKLPHDRAVVSVKFSPDDRRLLTASADGHARLWDAATGRLLITATGHSDKVFRVAFSPDGSRFITSATDHTVRVWDTATGLPLDEPLRHDTIEPAFVFWRGADSVTLAASGEPLLIYSVPRPPVPVPSWVPALAEALSGLTTNRTAAPDLLRLQAERTGTAEPGFWNMWVKNFFALPSDK